jgi:hypothetical protein
LLKDQVSGEKKAICADCAKLKTVCYLCGLPARKDHTELPDGRILCARDATQVVLDEKEALQICREVKKILGRLFFRSTTFPGTNVVFKLADRVNVLTMFRTPGHDLECPNVLGFYQAKTNRSALQHEIYLLTGLPAASLKAVCAHEYAHAWVRENVSRERREAMSRDAEEGFCELIAFLVLQDQKESAEQAKLLDNVYTRGQVHYFIEAETRFGFSEVAQWMRYGTEAALTDNPMCVRWIQPPTASKPGVDWTVTPTPPERLKLQAITWIPTRPSILINNQMMVVDEEARIRVGKTNVVIRCLAIREDSALVQFVESGERRELRLTNW